MIDKPVEKQDSQGQIDEVQKEVAVVVDADAIVDPRAMAGLALAISLSRVHNLPVADRVREYRRCVTY